MADADAAAVAANQAIAFQERFFSAPNLFRLDAQPGSADGLSQVVQLSLKHHRSGHVDRPILLPFRESERQGTVWFACVPNGAMQRALGSELAAFLGPSYIEVAPAEREPDVAHTHARPLLDSIGLLSIRFCCTDPKYEQHMLGQWALYWKLLDRRPVAASYVPLTFDQLRSAFDRSLAARDESSARAALAGLRERFGLSAENRLFLDIRLSSAFERWEEVATHRLLSTIVHLNLPQETYGDVLEALYEAHIRPFERARRIDDLLQQFRDTVAESARPLFRTRKSSARPAVLKAFVLQELIQDEPKVEVCSELLARLPIGAFGELDEGIRQRAVALTPVDDLLPARQALEREEFDRAYSLLWPLHDQVDVLRGLVLCAREAEDPAKANEVLTRLAAAPADVRVAVEAASPGRLQRLRALAQRNRPALTIWSDSFGQFEDESVDDYVERWRELARASDPEVVLAHSNVGYVAAECLMHQALEKPDTFDRLYPLWHELFVERVPPGPQLVPVYQALLEALRLRGRFTETELELVHQTLVVLVRAGADQRQYGKAVNEVREIFHEVRSPQVLSWALDVCDGLALAPARDSEARMRLLSAVVQACIDFRERLTDVQRALVRLLAGEVGLGVPDVDARTAEQESTSRASLRGRTIAFYSLDEAALRRAVEILKGLYPQLRTECNMDTVCTPRLKALAAQADAFVFAWKSSKHAAFDCVKAVARAKESLVMARGAGTTSLLAAAQERISAFLAQPV